jgi:fumarate reductase subunit D
VKDIARLWAGEIDRLAGGSLLRLWRSLHRIMAILMVLSVAIHIGVAWFYGYRWIFTKQ